ncbi:MAG: methyltransferase [Planctomycetes bacterium]|nr:methyltransferase [Planctomycetota bacterium]
MSITASVLLIDEEGSGFVSTLAIGITDHRTPSQRELSRDSESLLTSWHISQDLARQTVSALGIAELQLTYSIGESDLNRTHPCIEGTDGKSLGMAFYIASVAAHLGLSIRKDVAFTGCLEDAGHFRYAGAMIQKILGTHGARSTPEILRVVAGPPPTSSGDLGIEQPQRYQEILDEFKTSSSGRSYLIIETVEDVWKPGNLLKIFDPSSWFVFALKNQRLFNRAPLSGSTDSLESSVHSLTAYYSENLWLDFDAYLAETPDAIEHFLGHLRDLALEYFTEKDAVGLANLLSTLGRNMSYDRLLDFVNRDDLLTAFGREFPISLHDRYEESYASLRKTVNDLLGQELSLNSDVLREAVHDEFSSFNAQMNNVVRLLEVFFDIDPALARKAYDQVSLFAELEIAARQHRETEENNLSTFINSLVLAEPIKRLMQIKYGLLDNVEIDEQGHACLTDKKVAMDVCIKPDLSDLRFDIVEDVAKTIIKQQDENLVPFLFPVRGNNAIQDPVLLWQQSYRSLCLDWQADDYDENNCAILNLPDGHFYYKDKEEKKHKSEGLIQRLFSRAPMTISFSSRKGNETSVLWSNQYGWPPSIDSLWFASVLEDSGICDERNRLIADIGSGTGFLGIFCAQNCPHAKLVAFSDLNRAVTLLTEHNCRRNLKNSPSHKWQYMTMTASGLTCYRQFVREYGKVDLCILAPPYLPKVREYGIASGLSVAVSGTKLLEDMVTEGRSITKTLVVQFSAIAQPEFEEACEKAGVQAVCLGTRDVPVRIDMVQPYHPQLDYRINPKDETRSQEYQYLLERYQMLKRYNEFLQEERNLKCLNRKNYKWWHELRVFRVDF